MSSVKGTRTEHNLLASFAGESQARSRYELFAAKAREEGYEQIAAIFEDTANQELSHAKQFFSHLEGGEVTINAGYPAGVVGDTLSNLIAARNGEHEEWSDLYESFAATAEEEGFKEIAILYRLVAKAETVHEARYNRLVERMQSGTVFTSPDEDVDWQCRQCGFVFHGKTAPKKCPVCGRPQGWFERRYDNY